MQQDTNLIAELSDIVGTGNVLVADNQKAPYLTDWTGKFSGAALAVVRPANTNQVSEIVRKCHENGVPIVAQGGNTGLSGGAIPDTSGDAVLISLSRMSAIREIDLIGNTITVDAGCVLANVQNAAEEKQRYFPLSLGAEGSCTVGGNLATNAGGVAVLRYGTMRELTLGLEVVLPDGRVWNGMRALRKDNTGYSLRDLFIGSEGTLGIITAAVLKLYPIRTAHAVALCSADGLEQALDLFKHVRAACGDRLTAFEYMDQPTLQLMRDKTPTAFVNVVPADKAAVLIELSDADDQELLDARFEKILESALEMDLIQDAVPARDYGQIRSFWRMRESISEALVKSGPVAKHDVSLPIANLASFISEARTIVNSVSPHASPVIFGHLGDGNLHYNVVAGSLTCEDEKRAFFGTLPEEIHRLVTKKNGSISAEHGIGQLRAGELMQNKQQLELEIMATIKSALDPNWLLNPAKLLDGALKVPKLTRDRGTN